MSEAPQSKASPLALSRYGKFPLLGLASALLLSFAVHFETADAVQWLATFGPLRPNLDADELTSKVPKPRDEPVTIEVLSGVALEEMRPSPEDPEHDRLRPEREEERETVRRAREPEPERPIAELPVVPPEAERPPPPPQPTRDLQAVEQHSQDPTVAPPENFQFLAEHNNRVEEETVARIRNDVRDDAQPSAADARVSGLEEDGNDTETDVAHLREMEGSDVREPTPSEAEENRPEEASEEPPAVLAESQGNTATTGPNGRTRDGETVPQEPGHEGGGTDAPAEVALNDGFGTIRMQRRETRPPGQGEGERGGEHRDGPPEPLLRERGQQGRGRGVMDIGPNARPAWAELTRLMDDTELDQERETYIAERQSTTRGSQRSATWAEFRAALENFTPTVRPGEQTALNTAASPFATYLAQVHRRIHRDFADRFLRNLPSWSTSEFADRSMMTELEIILNRDGTVHRVAVVRTSGYMPYDYGAFNSVMRGQPYPEAPQSILSGDGRVYFHWGFYRNERQCGTFNASPYILPHPPGTPAGPSGPLQDGLNLGGVVPADAQPTHGLPGEAGGPPAEGNGDDGISTERPPDSPY